MGEEYSPPEGADEATHGERVRATYDWTDVPVATAVIETVAAAEDTDPERLEPLYDWIDVDALDALFQGTSDSSRRSRVFVSFRYVGYDVTVGEDGIIVEPTRQA